MPRNRSGAPPLEPDRPVAYARFAAKRRNAMAYVAIVAALAVLQLVYFGVLTGRARGQYKVEAPATSGHPIFERHFRVQQNTLEQMVIFLPGLYLFGHYVSEPIAALIGSVYLVG